MNSVKVVPWRILLFHDQAKSLQYLFGLVHFYLSGQAILNESYRPIETRPSDGRPDGDGVISYE